jgi:hypothetical protein
MRRLLIIIWLIGSAASGHAAVDLTEWSWQRTIDVGDVGDAGDAAAVGTSPGFVRLAIVPEIFNESQAALHDLRVIDEGNRLVPHVIHWGRVEGTLRQEWQPARLLNASFAPGKYASVIADFGESAEKNSVMVTLSGQNYRRRALVEGSRDSHAWEGVAEEMWLFDVSLPGQRFRADTIRFPVNNFRYLRLTVFNMPDDPRRITIDTVQFAFQRTGMEKELKSLPVKQMGVSQDEKEKQTVIDLDLGSRNLPVASLRLEIATPYFYRGYELFGRNQSREKIPRKTETQWDTTEREVPWQSIHRGVFYRIQYKQKTGESVKVETIRAPYRYLQLRIFNGDNPPLKLENVAVYWRETSLVFQAEAGRRYRLIGGNPRAGEPNYDLARSIHGIDDFKLPVAGLGLLTATPRREQLSPWTERHSTLIWVILLLAVGAMLTLVLKNLKKLPSSPTGQADAEKEKES